MPAPAAPWQPSTILRAGGRRKERAVDPTHCCRQGRGCQCGAASSIYLGQVQSCNHRHWVWGSLRPLCPAWQLLLWLLKEWESKLQATPTSVLSVHNTWAGSWAQGQAITVGGTLCKLFPALPGHPRTPSPSLGTKSTGLISVPRWGPQGCCPTFSLTAAGRTFS